MVVGWLSHNYILNSHILVYLSIFPICAQTTGIKRIAGPMCMNFGMSTCGVIDGYFMIIF